MLASNATVQSVTSIQLVIALFAITIVMFWRAILKMLLVIAAVLAIILLASGTIVLIEGIHHIVK